MAWLLIIAVVLALVYAPAWWVRRVMRRYSQPADRYQGSGAELARHLLDRLGLESVTVRPAPEAGTAAVKTATTT